MQGIDGSQDEHGYRTNRWNSISSTLIMTLLNFSRRYGFRDSVPAERSDVATEAGTLFTTQAFYLLLLDTAWHLAR